MSLEELEKLRLNAKRCKKNAVILFFLLMIIFILMKNFNISEKDFAICAYLFILVIVVSLIVYIVKYLKSVDQFTDYYKDTIVLNCVKQKFDNVSYIPNDGIKEEEIEDINMISLGNRYSSEDLVCAKYKKIDIKFSDVYIALETTDSDGDTHTKVYFEGQWIICDLERKFNKKFYIAQSNFYADYPGKLKKVELENIDFNKNFNVYCEEEFDVFYFLTPTIMEKINKLIELTDGDIIMCFIDNKIHIGINNDKSIFEPDLDSPVNIDEMNNRVYKDLDSVISFIDFLYMDSDIFVK